MTLTTRSIAFRKTIIPGDMAFIQASDLIWRACEQITDDPALISKCLGARPKTYECGCQKDTSNDQNKNGNCAMLGDWRNANSIAAEQRSLFEAKAKTDTCPLIVFAETWSARVRRFSGASARLDWLSIPRRSVVRMSDTVIRAPGDARAPR